MISLGDRFNLFPMPPLSACQPVSETEAESGSPCPPLSPNLIEQPVHSLPYDVLMMDKSGSSKAVIRVGVELGCRMNRGALCDKLNTVATRIGIDLNG